MDADGKPVDGGINDLHMGTVDKKEKCKTCGCNFEQCPGHFGHIKLEKPVYHVGYITQCRKILKCVCHYCSRVLRPAKDGKEKLEQIRKIKNPAKRAHDLYELCKDIKKCEMEKNEEDNDDNQQPYEWTEETGAANQNNSRGCGRMQPIYKEDPQNKLRILMELRDDPADEDGDRKDAITAEQCLRIFKKISDEDCYLLGLDPKMSRPEWMIIQLLAVCPPQVRPSVSVDAVLRSEDDLTFQYCHILKLNQEIKGQLVHGGQGHNIEETMNALQFFVATLMNNEMPSGKVQQRSGRPIKAISARLKGKEGRLRQNLMGKRVDFSARSVISPDPNLLLDELGVPVSIAMNVTFPERVTSRNIERLRQLVMNGATKYPGAKFIVRDDGTRIDLRFQKTLSDIHIAEGYIVERHTQNGDYVLFNRQPSLHKMSMMCHRVHVLPYSTFRLNLSVTTPYNADFDGDEMNMHVPQSYETVSELANIMHVPKQILSPQSNKPVMGIVQDTLIGVKLFTHRDNYITYEQVMNLVMWINDFDGKLPMPAIVKPIPLWTGKQIFSLILPKVNLRRYTSNHTDELGAKMNLIDSVVEIQDGELVQGIVCKKTVGNTSGGLIHCIWNEYGPDKTLWFLTNCQRLVNNWTLLSGFTVGVSDIISDEATNASIQTTLENVKKEVKMKLEDAQLGKLECQPGKGMVESFEATANGALNKARETAGKSVQQALKLKNHLKNMVIAGSKGNNTNISQIIGCVGQQNVEGKRIPFNFNHRTLPHFLKDDYGAESRGFVENSYLKGLTPQEFYFHAMGGREGIIDTAIKTSQTGYIQRRLIKALEDVMVQYDGTVRNGRGNILEFIYGEDGMTGEYIEDQKIETMLMNNEQLEQKYLFFNETQNQEELQNNLRKFLQNNIVDQIIYDDFEKVKTAIKKEFEQIKKDRDELRNEVFLNGEDKQHFPVNIPRIILNARMRFGINDNSISDLDPLKVINKINGLKESLIVVKGDDPISKQAQESALRLLSIVINYNLCCKKVIQTNRLTEKALNWIIGEIQSRFLQALVKPGEMVGNIAAQSIGEPATQMTLNTFHFAGVSSLNVTLGVPRLQEVINVVKKLKTPSMKMYLKPLPQMETISQEDYDKATELTVKRIHGDIEITSMADIVIKSEIYFDPDIFNTLIKEDQEIIDMQMDFYKDDYKQREHNISPWVLRIVADSNILYAKSLTMNYIEERIQENFSNLDIIHTEDNNERKVFRIRIEYKEDIRSDNKRNKYKNTRFTREQARSLEELTKLEGNLLRSVVLKGVPEIRKLYAKKVPINLFNQFTGEKREKFEEWLIETDGTNMVAAFDNDDLDFKRITTNDINEIYNVLGIEAVRNSLINEVRSVLKPYDIYVNYRHICILCDLMTQNGFLTSITRHGLNRAGRGPIRKCSFEETVDILIEAGIFAEKDDLIGISENILVGQLAPLGTGSFDLLIDLEQIEKGLGQNEEMAQPKFGEFNMENNSMGKGPYDDSNSSGDRTPYNINSTPNIPIKGNVLSFASHSNSNPSGPSFTPGYPLAQSPGRMINPKENLYISTPNPNVRPNSPSFGPSNYLRTPGPYSPLPFDSEGAGQQGSDYGGPYSPLQRSPGNQSGYGPSSVRRRSGYFDTTTPRSIYSPTTPGMRQNSSGSPAYSQGSGLFSSTPQQNSGSGPSQYSPLSPTYNPLSPRYGANIQSNYSRNSPFYNPTVNSGSNNAMYGGSNAANAGSSNNENEQKKEEDKNKNNKPGESPIQSDEEGENEN
ncbi:MAG: DNA-directed RNA polymerase subunit A' [archaeon]|nr:DNA-directed RNA polymerase subunit A' [archaeon]